MAAFAFDLLPCRTNRPTAAMLAGIDALFHFTACAIRSHLEDQLRGPQGGGFNNAAAADVGDILRAESDLFGPLALACPEHVVPIGRLQRTSKRVNTVGIVSNRRIAAAEHE